MGLYRRVNGQLEVVSGANSSGLPLGSIIPIYSITVPTGFLPCNGQQFDTTQYPSLYALLGSNTLPDLRESTLVGIGTSDRVEITDHDVYTLGQFKDDQLQEHSHTVLGTYGFNYTSGDFPAAMSTHETQQTQTTGTTGRFGTTTHGKQTGVFFVIKAVPGLADKVDIKTDIKSIVAASTDFADFQTNIAAW